MSNNMIKTNLGGERLGSGKKMEVAMRNFERSTHNLSRMWKSSMAPGTLVPCFVEIALNGDTFDIDTAGAVKTIPTIQPLYGSFKLQVDYFSCPIRLYNKMLHNNALGIGMHMDRVKFPLVRFTAPNISYISDYNNQQVNSSSLIAYLGIRGVGRSTNGNKYIARAFNAIPLLAYWDIFKNYYSNKQETNAYFVGAEITGSQKPTVISCTKTSGTVSTYYFTPEGDIIAQTNPLTVDAGDSLIFEGSNMNILGLKITAKPTTESESTEEIEFTNFFSTITKNTTTESGGIVSPTYAGYEITKIVGTTASTYSSEVKLESFPLENIDQMRDNILSANSETPFYINENSIAPYGNNFKKVTATGTPEGSCNIINEMYGLAVKTYQSDRFNNWLSQEWIEGTNGIAEITAIDTSSGKFTIDSFIISKKIYTMLNRVAVKDGTFRSWQEAVYGEAPHTFESPMYIGGMSGSITFDEVTQLVETEDVPLGTLAGKANNNNRYNGSTIHYRCKEPSIIMGIVSITPRIEYCQGNKWFVNLETMDDLHKPNLDGIGFQNLSTDEIASFDTWVDIYGNTKNFSAGKQPAWIEYMTSQNEVYGDFAKQGNLMGMTLVRKYESKTLTENDENTSIIKDLTTYIDPQKFNYAFANTSNSAQNFWTFLAIDCKARRKMSAKVIPNL